MGFPAKKDLPVVVIEKGNIEKALRELRARMNNAKVFRTLKLRTFHPSPSARRRFKCHEAERALRKRMKEQAATGRASE